MIDRDRCQGVRDRLGEKANPATGVGSRVLPASSGFPLKVRR